MHWKSIVCQRVCSLKFSLLCQECRDSVRNFETRSGWIYDLTNFTDWTYSEARILLFGLFLNAIHITNILISRPGAWPRSRRWWSPSRRCHFWSWAWPVEQERGSRTRSHHIEVKPAVGAHASRWEDARPADRHQPQPWVGGHQRGAGGHAWVLGCILWLHWTI